MKNSQLHGCKYYILSKKLCLCIIGLEWHISVSFHEYRCYTHARSNELKESFDETKQEPELNQT